MSGLLHSVPPDIYSDLIGTKFIIVDMKKFCYQSLVGNIPKSYYLKPAL
jgi:hypothetical protein